MTATLTEPLERSRYEVLIDVARRLSSSRNLDELIDLILRRSRDVMDCDICSILLPAGPDESLLIRSTMDATNIAGIRVPKGKGIAGHVYLTRETVNLRNAAADERHFRPPSDFSDFVVGALLCIPLLDGDRCLGVMQALNPNHREVFGRHDEELFESLGSLIAVTLLRLESQKKAIAEAEMRQQMQLAKEIQDSFLPSNRLRVGELSVEAFYQPASEIGGDFYFWHEIGEGMLLLGIGDVCGKGLPAALDMARSTTLIASMAFQCRRLGLERWVSELNRRLCTMMRAGRFIAICAVLLDTNRRRGWACNAGLPTAKVKGRDGWRDVVAPGNPPLGISCDIQYRDRPFPLGLGKQCLLFSDGILELQNGNAEYFEDAAFQNIFDRVARNGTSVLEELAAEWRQFADGASYRDDATALLVIDHAIAPPESIVLTCEPDALKGVRDFVDQWAALAGFDHESAGMIVLGCDEVFSNLCKHAYCACEDGGPATCRIMMDDAYLHILVEHQGKSITNEEFCKKAEAPVDPERVGGMGCKVIRQIFDKVQFERGNGFASIKLSKKLVFEPFVGGDWDGVDAT